MRLKAEWAIDSEAMRTRGIIVKYHICFPQEVRDEAGSDKGAIDGGSENEFEAREFSKFVSLLAEIVNSDGPYLFKS